MSQNSVHEALDTQAGRHLLEIAEERGYVEPAELEAFVLELDLGDEEMAEVTHELETLGLEIGAPRRGGQPVGGRAEPRRPPRAPATACSSSSPTSAATSC